ncbi:DUF3703 domain-containing protein [Acidovorax sp. LjRoot118]|uniref:DUF3703 domain-containing protein n=1 Tax=Acidovorax sp. LjRoot118 TaxID=3342256 RepID=UPI003ED00A4F
MTDIHHAPAVPRFRSARLAYRHEIAMMKSALLACDEKAALRHVVRAHILGQRYLIPHVTSHAWMMRMAWTRGDKFELLGQLRRLLFALPAWLVGWVPVGNPGLASVSPLRPVPMSQDLAVYFVNDSIWRHVLLRLGLLALAALMAFASTLLSINA